MVPGMPGMPPTSGASMPGRPLFPSASAVSSASSTAVTTPYGADFKPITSIAGNSIGPVKPTFPAYGNSDNKTSSYSNDSKQNIMTAGTSKIIHPQEDLSLVL